MVRMVGSDGSDGADGWFGRLIWWDGWCDGLGSYLVGWLLLVWLEEWLDW